MSERMVAEGRVIRPTHIAAVQADVAPGDAWVYVERVGRVLQVWSGPACSDCRVAGRKLERCVLHASVMIVARQMELVAVDLDQPEPIEENV